MPTGRVLAVATCALTLVALPPALAGGTTTLDRTIEVDENDDFWALERGPGENHKVRQAGLGQRQSGRSSRRRSLAYFSQLTDPQVADEMSPGRIELFDPANGDISAAWRPQEAFGTQVLDQVVRSVDANGASPVRGRHGRAELGFAILTGDQPDNQQLNETLWHQAVLDGERLTPFSGQPISGSNPCPGADAEMIAALDQAVAERRYTGVQDFDDYPGVPERYAGFWDPDQAGPPGLYSAFPRYPGLMERAQRGFKAKGLDVPWYMSRGNHDGLIQGNIVANSELFVNLVVGCEKIFPNADFDPASLEGQSGAEIADKFQDPAALAELTKGFRKVPPDPDRRFLSVNEYIDVHRGGDDDHGFGFVANGQRNNSAGTAAYYAFSPQPNLRFIALDTVAQGGGASGNVDDPQYDWLKRQLDRNSAVSYNSKGKLRRDGDRNRLIVVYGHHTLETMDNPAPDEDAGPCTTPPLPGCDADPRDSRPIHLGTKGKKSIEQLLLRYPNVIAAVTGHTHHNAVSAFKRNNPSGGFWQINTASHIDFPQQSRLIELMNNRDGTLSIFGTVVDHAAPIEPPAPGAANGLSNAELASLSRQLAANDPQRDAVTEQAQGGTGKRRDRNVELVIRDPRRLAK